jgi:L-seryl-tRNA(Ser) seleniumtransferase
MLALDAAQVGTRAEALRRAITRRAPGARARLAVVDGVSRTGGGSSPSGERPTRLLSIAEPGGDAAGLEQALRRGDPPIVGRIHDGKLLLDLRTVLPSEDEALATRIAEALAIKR